jgi:dolichol kinase
MTELPSVDKSYVAEVMRKSIHLASLAIPVVYFFIGKSLALSILVPLTVAFAMADLLRLWHEPTGRLYQRYVGFLLRRHERHDSGRRLNGATYVLVSAALCMLVLPKVIFVTAFAILIVSDTAAALVGRRFGRHRFLGKSLEGSTAFFLSALVVVLIAPKITGLPVEYAIGLAGAMFGAVVEALPLPVDDNLSIPFTIGAAMWILYALLMPGRDLFVLG